MVRARLAAVGVYVDELTPEDLDRPVANHAKTVGGALGVLLGELTAHTRFINRDLDIVESSQPT